MKEMGPKGVRPWSEIKLERKTRPRTELFRKHLGVVL